MQFILRSLQKPPGRSRRRRHHHQSLCTFVEAAAAAIKWVRDRGLDHAVEKERNLKPMLNLKNLIKSEPSKSVPLSIIAQNKDSLGIHARPIEFVRRYPSVFEEFLPGGIGIHPHIKLTLEVLGLDAEEQLIYQSDNYKQEVADRLLKLLMLARINKIPLQIIESLKFDLGLPQDYTQSIVPEFPDYFQVTGGNDSLLELVCWSNEHSVSVMENKAMSGDMGYEKGMQLAFPLHYSRGFEMDKKFKKWVNEWQKLPYISPYENTLHLAPKSDESDKWVVAVLHELLNLFVPKKTERENILRLGEYLGLRSRFKRALLHHPGIFYLSGKVGTRTVVLREVYKRDSLIDKHPLMDMRSKYIHLMNSVKEDHKTKGIQGGRTRQQKATHDSKEGEGEELEDDESGEEQDGELYGLSDSEVEDDSDDDNEEGWDDEDGSAMNKGRTSRKTHFEEKMHPRNAPKGLAGRNSNKTMGKNPSRFSRITQKPGSQNFRGRSPERLDVSRTRERSNLDGRRTSTW